MRGAADEGVGVEASPGAKGPAAIQKRKYLLL